MFPAFLAACFFALSAIFAHRTTKLVGAFNANLARIWIATSILGLIVVLRGLAFGGASLMPFILSGVVGYGLGDLALFAAYPRLGSRLTSLMMQCLAAPFGAIIEWLWLGTHPRAIDLVCGAAILVGVGLAVAPSRSAAHAEIPLPQRRERGHRVVGLVCGTLAALGQGGGAVMSRKAYAVAHAAGQTIEGFAAAFERALGGVVVVTIAWLFFRHVGKAAESESPLNLKAAAPWIFATALSGATLGVSCFQWALSSTPTAIVLPIVALTPLIVVPLAYWLEHERPSKRSIFGGVLAVAAAVVLASLRH